MATRRQKQLERKYSSFRRYVATEDVNYAAHSSRSSYRSESVTSRDNARGRSSSTEISTGSETRSLPVYIAIQDYNPEPNDLEAIPLEQGQIVEVLDNKNAASWLVRTKARPPQSGWVPGSYFETPTEYYKQRRRTRELASDNLKMSDEQEAIMKRDQVYHDLLRTEEDFVTDLSSILDNYVRAFDDPGIPEAIRQHKNELAMNLRELYNFHANVMLKGLQYYSDDPGKVGHTFIRLERDFDHHVDFYREYPRILKLIEGDPAIKEYLQGLSDKIEAGARGYPDYLKQIEDRVKQYADFFKEIIKYSARAQTSTKSMQKALELVQSIPKRANDSSITDNIQNYQGDTNRLGRIYRHDLFQVWEGDEPVTDRYIFLFKNKLMFTDKDSKLDLPSFKHYSTIRLDKYTARVHTGDEDTIVLRPNEPGLPSFRIKAKDQQSQEIIRKAWLKDINEMQDAYLMEHPDTTSVTGTEFDVISMSDVRSEFSEYSNETRKSSLYNAPEEGPARRKVKSPPGISPTGSSTSLYSGGSSIDWTTTGTTLEMQGTRVTRTQYGFRTLQESSAKMCLKVTGYPLPEITWYKDDKLLQEDERRTFYADEDGFFAMTIDPVQVTDTGRYTCCATNEYGQASTSAFFRVLKVEKEAAPPAFAFQLKDQEVKEGEVVSFECEVDGWPEPELIWMVDDQPLRPSHDFRLQYDGQSAKLEIRDAQPEDTGSYSVKITNEYGTKESTAKLIVQADPDKNHVSPEFQAVIEDAECNEGDTVKFKAVLTGDPTPEVTWLINGIPLTESEKIKFICEDGICILTIKDVSRHFDGTVTCQGKNRLGTSSCDAQLRIKVPPSAPAFDRPLEDRMITEKSAVMFDCDVSGYPDPKVEFTLKGVPIVNGQDGIEIQQRDGNYRITISNVSMDKHDGEIIAKASNPHGQAESRARLIVEPEEEESRSAPTFIKDIEDQTVKSGEAATFSATVRGNPNPTIQWFINGTKLDSASSGIKIETNGADHKLIIQDSTKYAGTVLCRAENSIGRFETKARLIVLPTEKKKKAPEFIEKLQDKSETEGTTAIFECRIEAEPRAQFKWTLNGEELKESIRVHFREFDGSIKVEISDLKLSETGTLKCTVSNSEGEATSEAKLTVNRKPSKPNFEQKPKNVSVERGNEAIFSAVVDGAPLPEITWSIGGRKIRPTSDGAKVEVQPDGSTKLIIDTNKFFENATISISAENSSGADETGALLNIEEPKYEPPQTPKKTTAKMGEEQFGEEKMNGFEIIDESQIAKEGMNEDSFGKANSTEKLVIERGLKDQTIEKGGLGHFEAVIKNATNIQWSFDGKQLQSGQDGVKISQDDKFEFRLTLDSNKFENSGRVTIKASNASDSVEQSAQMTITQKSKESQTPSFTDQLKDISAEIGKPLSVDVIALNEPNFKWLLNGKQLEDGKDGVRILKDNNKSTLKIDEIKPEHAGTITVVAENEAGKSESSGKISVESAKTPAKISDGPKPVTANEKESVEFNTTVSGEPQPKVKWVLNEKVIESSEQNIIISSSGDKHTLRINDLKVEQSGKVEVRVENSVGTDSASTELKVKPAEIKPKFKATLSDSKVEAGKPLSFNVSLENPTPNTKVNWYLNGKKLESSDGIKISEDGNGTYKLEISSATPEMNGTLTVRAENSQGSDETKARVEVATGEREPKFSKTPRGDDVEEGASVKFSAIVTGVPPAEVEWYLNDEKIVSGDEIRIKYDTETGKTSIRIFKTKVEQTGKVKVKAANKLGSVESSAELKVSKKREIPHFIKELSDRQVNEGTDLKFQARIAAFPDPEVEWTLNGKPIKADNIKTSVSGDTYTIEFTKVQLDQAGELAIEARNSIGHKKTNCTLAVKEMGIAPNFTMNLTDRLVEEKETVVMEAQMNKEVRPKPTLEWLKDGKPFTDSRYKTSYDEGNGILKLTIVNAEISDKSRITIKAENRWGSAECSASIGVTKKRSMAKPQFLSELAPVTITEGDTLQTKVIITGDPKPYAKWYINNTMVCQTEDTEMTEQNGVYSLTIHGCSTDMTGKIKVVAGNKMGEATTEGKLTVIAPIPVEFETSLCDATCREGDTLKLKAVLLGEPEPTVSWYVNGKKLEESQNIKIHSEKGTYTVTIKDITMDYSGKVVCEAVNEFGKASSEATLLVLPRGEPPDFIEWLSNIRARQGSSISHKVVFTGDPRPELFWYINNQEIKDGLEGYTIKTTGNTSILTIKNFNPDKHVGEVICKAENQAGEVSCTANMATYTSSMVSESESEAFAEDVGVVDDLTEAGSDAESIRDETTRTPTPVMAPKFITKIKDTRANRGHQAVFECIVPDTKGVVCKWLKDGKEIQILARIRVQTRTIEGHITNELIIDDVQPEDAGKYTVVCENTAGLERCEATLTVLESLQKPTSKAPEFTVQLKDKQAKTADRVIFECKVVGEPKPSVEWFHGEERLYEESKKIIIESDEGVERLVIESSQVKDSGMYKAVATNSAGKTTSEAKLEVRDEFESADKRGAGAPEFVELLRSALTSAGAEAILKCKVKGEPRPTIQWTRQGKTVEISDRVTTEYKEDGSIILTIQNATDADSGEYRCEATNDFGNAWTEAPVILAAAGTLPTDGEAPDFLAPVRPITVKVGEKAVLEGKIIGTPEPSVKWYKANVEIAKNDQRYKIEALPDGTQRLTVNEAAFEDIGEYRCEATNKWGDVWSDATMTVHAAASEETGHGMIVPTFTRSLQETTARENEHTEFEVIVGGSPLPEIKWFIDNKEIKSDDQHFKQSIDNDGKAKLVIKDAKKDDAGKYKCEAINPAGTATSEAPLKVLPGGKGEKAPEFSQQLKPTSAKEDEKIVFDCKVEGHPPPTVAWFKDGQELRADERIKVESTSDGRQKLTIEKAKIDDQGNYRVEATNDLGSTSSKAPLTVEPAEKLRIKRGLYDKQVPIESKVQLSVEVEGHPKTVKWFKGNNEINESSANHMEKVTEEEYRLTINKVGLSDTGAYRVVLSTETQSVESNCQVTVTDGTDGKPGFRKGLADQQVPKGSPLRLEIEVDGKPKEIKWYRNGDELKPDGKKIKVEDLGNGKYAIVIPETGEEDFGNYSVKISNDSGSAESKANISAREDKPEIVSGLKPITVKPGERAAFEVEVKGPVKQVKWYKNGNELTNCQTEELNGKKFRLIIPSAKGEDAGDYRVVLSNDAGNADSNAALTVTLPAGKLSFVKPLKDVTANKGDTVPLEIELSGKPKEVKWYKNGNEIKPGDKEQPKKISDTKYQLVLPDVDADGQFKVVAIGDDDTPADSACALTVKLPADKSKKLSFVKPLQDVTANKGDTVPLEIELSDKPKQVKWYKNGKELKSGDKEQPKKISDTKYQLLLPDVDADGQFKVVATNEDDAPIDSSCALTVKLPSEKATDEPKLAFLKPLKDIEVTEGEPAEFQIETNAKPRSVKWYKNGQEVKSDARFKIETIDDTKYRLTIPKTTQDDAGTFKVVLENSAGPVDSSASLTVKSGKKNPPTISKGLEDQIVAKGYGIIFEVKIDGDVSEVRWLKDGRPVEKANASAKIEKVDGNTYRLTIPKADMGDAGDYEVQASNPDGKATSAAKAEVDEKPEIVKGLIPANIDEGDDQVFRVEVSAPIRQVKWYKNGQEIKPSAHMQPKQVNPKKFELTINKSQLDDGATYRVVLSNKAGECESTADLKVEKPNILKLVQGLSDVNVDEGQPFTFSCKITGTPKSVIWFKNGKPIEPSDERYKLSSNPETGEYSLSVDSSIPTDSAAFKVIFANDKGDVQSGAVSYIKKGKPKEAEARAPTFISPLKDVDIEEGDTLTLKCQISAEPQPTLKWFCNGEELKPSNRVVMRLALDGTATLRVMDSKKSDAGTYKVVATNSSGSLDSSCKVGVLSSDEMPSPPKFIVPLRSSDAPLGAKAEFNVKVRGVPKPSIRFQIDGRNVPIDNDRITLEDMHDGNWCLTIKEVKEEDFGTLRCVAENENGKDECEAIFDQTGGRKPKARDEEGYPPRFNVPLWDRRVPLGDPMFIECHVDAKPLAEITWTFNNDELKPAQGIQIEYTPEGACRVKISEFLEKHVGAYKCFAKNMYGTADTIANLNIEVKEEKEEQRKIEYAPKFNPQLEDQTLNEGGTISLSCRVDAIPIASIVPYKDGLPVKNSDRLKWTYDPNSGQITLTVTDVRDGDGGAYRIVASNHLGSTNTACLVTVKTKKVEHKKEGEEPFFTKGLVDKYVDRGETLELTCAVTGDPQPEIRWYRNGTLLRASPRVIIENNPDGTCKLTIKDTTMSDEGLYRCEAENAHGRAKTQCTGFVQMAIKREKTPVIEGEAPKFVVPLEDTSVRMKGLIEMECKVTGIPMPTIKWSKDGGPLIEDARYEWDNNPEKGTYSLKIRNANLYDEGTIRAVATNESGSATSKGMIRIDDGTFGGKVEASTAPRISLRLADVRVNEGQPLKLLCKVEGTPMPTLDWYKDGEKVIPSDRCQLEVTPEGTATLYIPKATMDDDGLYRVIATNPAGSAVDKCTATVRRGPRGATDDGRGASPAASLDRFDSNKAPRCIVPLDNVRVPEKQSFKLKCKFTGDPKPTIKWFKDGERIYSYTRCQLSESSDGTCELVVESASRSDAGMYRVVAENDYGSARTTCEVTVQLKDRTKPTFDDSQALEGNAPGFSIPLTVKRAKEGETVVFECLPYGKPFPAIKWLKDGMDLVPNDKIKIEALDDHTQRLTIDGVDILSAGYFRCVATNEFGTASTKAELTITGERRPITNGLPVENGGPPEESKPRIRRGLYPMSIHQGNAVEMQVCATGWPVPTVKWFKNGEEIKSEGPDGRRTIWTDERGIHHCVIINTQPEDEGDYSLVATNPLGEAKTEGPLSVIRPRHPVEGGEMDKHGGMPFPPGFIRQLKNKHVFTHMPTIFDCLVVGYPPPTVDWYHNGKKIVADGRTKIQVAGGGSHALIILDSTLDDSGEYVAIARNSHGTAQSSAILDVTVPHLDNIKFDGSIDVTPYLTEEYGFKKINYKCLPTPPDRGPFIKEVTGHYLTLSWIPTKRTPPRYPQVTYVIEIRELPEREWTLLDYNIPEPVCKVRNLELGKSYQFRVRAENIYGISDPSPPSPPSRLMAPPRPVLDKNKRVIPLLDPYAERALEQAYAEQYACAPWFSPGVQDHRYCAENDTITISLSVNGYPDPKIQWKFRGWDVDTTSTSSNIRTTIIAGAETILTISGFSKQNAGQYQCFLTNQYGDAQQNIQIDLAERPSFIQPLMDRTYSDGKPMKLDVRVEGNPFPEIKWLRDWRPIVESHRVKFVNDGPYLCSMIITEPIWRDSGIYSVIAVNDAGQATTSCTVTVEADGEYNDVQLPRKKVGIQSKKVREIYEIAEEDEKKAAEGAPFIVKEVKSEELFVAQLKPFDDSLKRGVAMHNVLDNCRGFIQYRNIIVDQDLALVVYENANRSLLDNLLAPQRKPEGEDGNHRNREEEVRIFVKQLLTALQYMHHRNIAHLDLRPEVVLLQDDHLKLADFGQSRHLLCGRAHGEIQGSPEFVAPEVALGKTVTLAADMWSSGVLSYVLLTGLSPFLGDNDKETLSNVVAGNPNLSVPEFNEISPEAKDFLAKLLIVEPGRRMSVDQALEHDWLNDPKLADAKLSIDCLREFKYKHKWLERRVFVQQTPSEQFTQLIEAPIPSVAQSQEGESSQAAPFAVYDYLRIKDDHQQQPEISEYDPRGRPQRRSPRHSESPDYFGPSPPPPPQYFDPRGGDPRGLSPRGFDPRADPRHQQQYFDPRGFDPRNDPRYPGSPDQQHRPRSAPPNGALPPGPRPTQDELRELIQKQLPPGVKLPPGINPEDLLFVLPPPYHGPHGPPRDPRTLQDPRQQQQIPQMPPPPPKQRASSASPSADKQQQQRRPLQPQDKGETPSQNGYHPPKKVEEQSDNGQAPPLRLVRGERRDIEEEIANRILSDISEENSIAGSVASLDDVEPLLKFNRKNRSNRRSRSRSSTPLAEGSEGSLTPLALSPPPNGDSYGPLKEFFGENHIPNVPEFNDPSVPIGAPVFVDGLHKAAITVDLNTGKSRASLSPRPRSGTPGTKSPVLVSPGREHKMEVVIATKRGKQGRTSPMHDSADPLKKKRGGGDSDDEDDSPRKAKKTLHKKDDDFDDLMDEVEKIKQKYKKGPELDDLEKYRPKNFYKEEEDFHQKEDDIDDYPWESNYQIGPDTLLLATRGPEFNARVRDYRREIYGDGAPLVRQGFLGYRNQDITVRERRRFTDLIREDPNVAKSVAQTTKATEQFQNGSIRKITTTTVTAVPNATRKNSDGTYGPIFKNRLRDVCFVENAGQLILKCSVIGDPAPEVTWRQHESVLVEDGRHKMIRDGTLCLLTIIRPTQADIGEYSCTASNEFGKDICSARIVTGYTPGRPGRPDIELSSDTEVLLRWETPEASTYLEGITYKVEARPAGDSDHFAKWTCISDNVDDEAVVVKHLVPQGIYQFRVTAKNGFGWGLPSLTSRIIRTHPRGTPKLQLDMLRDQMKLSVITMPVRKGKSDPGLAEISEEAEEEASEEELSIDESITSKTSEPPLSLNKSDDPLSRFQLENPIFQTRYTLVRNAVDTKSTVAKHVVAKIRVKSQESPAELAEEFETLKSAQHENVVSLFAAYEKNSCLLLFTERLYENIFDRFTYPDNYNEEQIALSIRQLTAALHWIHFRGVLHLDVQPDNVMFATKRSWVIKLIDFEEAQFADSEKPIRKRKPANPQWAAPEMLQPNGVATEQTDIWGMGVICFTLLSGFHPFSDDGETPEEVKEAVCKQKCDPNLIPVQATQEALRFATWAIKKNPSRRIRTDEALSHKWLSNEKQMVRRRENVKYPSNRLRRTTLRTLNRPREMIDSNLFNSYGR